MPTCQHEGLAVLEEGDGRRRIGRRRRAREHGRLAGKHLESVDARRSARAVPHGRSSRSARRAAPNCAQSVLSYRVRI